MAPPNRADINQTKDQQNPQGQHTDASATLIGQVLDSMKVNDRATGQKAAGGDAQNPYDHIRNARSAAQEIQSFGTQGLKLTDQLQVTDVDGSKRVETVAQRIQELKQYIQLESMTAVGAADAIPQKGPNSVASMITETDNKIAPLAQKLGLDPRTMTEAQLQEKLSKTPQNDATYNDLKQLSDLQTNKENLEALRQSPATSRAAFAMYKMEGLANNQPIGQDGAIKANGGDLIDAYQLMKEAQRMNSDAKATEFFKQVNQATDQGMGQLVAGTRSGDIVNNLSQATQLSLQGKPDEAEKALQQANKTADGVNLSQLLSMYQDQRNRENPDVGPKLLAQIESVKEARMEYADFLNKHGRFDEATMYLMKAQADTPQLVQNDQSFKQLMQRAAAGNNTEGIDLNASLMKYNQAIQDKKFDEAQQELDKIQKASRNASDLASKLDPRLEEEKKRVEQRQADLAKDTTMDAATKDIESKRLKNELSLINQQLGVNKGQENFFEYTQYLRGFCDYSRGDNKSAHALFEEVKNKCPELYNNKDLHIDDLLEATRERGWFERNWDRIKGIAIPVIAGVCAFGAAALTFWSGPGAALAGAGTFGAVMAGLGAIGVGTAVGLGTDVGLHALSGDKITGATVKEGLLVGMTGATLAVTGPTFASYAAGMEGASGATTFAVGRLAPAAIAGFGPQAVVNGIDVADGSKTFGQASMDTLKDGAMSTAMMAFMPGKVWGPKGGMATIGGAESVGVSQVLPMGLRAAAWNNTTPIVVGGVGMGVDAYQNYSPWRIGFMDSAFGPRTNTPLDPSNQQQESIIWQRYDGVAPSVTYPGGDKTRPGNPTLVDPMMESRSSADITNRPSDQTTQPAQPTDQTKPGFKLKSPLYGGD